MASLFGPSKSTKPAGFLPDSEQHLVAERAEVAFFG